MSRLDAIRTAARPKMFGRAMVSGPSGAGKTWTSLSMATTLAKREDRAGQILVIDTEKESALTYADAFEFEHLPWRPPYDPTELVEVLREIDDRYAVVIIDSLSKFWQGLGGTLDIADGKFGGWKAARPVQESLVEAVLALPAHVFLGVRSKMAYAVEQSASGKQQVQKIGLAPQQDENLVYEVNIALDIDLEHRITCTKSRTPAVPVGRMYPAGHETKAAEDYADWLAGGVPPASRHAVESIIAAFDGIADDDRRTELKRTFVERFGMPHSLTANQADAATAWLTEQLGDDVDPPPAGGGVDRPDDTPPARPDDGAEAAGSGEPAASAPSSSEPQPGPDAPPATAPTPDERTAGVSVSDVGRYSTTVFKRDYDAAPKGDKTHTVERLRHALVYVVTGRAKRSLNECTGPELVTVQAWLRRIHEGTVHYGVDADGVTFVLVATDEEHDVRWSELELQAVA